MFKNYKILKFLLEVAKLAIVFFAGAEKESIINLF